jgi:hypothetical protein
MTQATQLTPFYTNYGFHPKTIWTLLEDSKNLASKAYAHWIKVTHDRAMQALEKNQRQYGQILQSISLTSIRIQG